MSIDIRRVTSEADRQEVFRLRYHIYVDEMKDPMRCADHGRRTIEESWDGTGHILAAFDGDRIVGSVRINFAADTDLGDYADLYQVYRFGKFYPDGLCITTRLMVLPSYRGGSVPLRLVRACFCYEEVISRGVGYNLIDCKPHHVSLFERFGYRQVMPNVRNPEAGETHPLVLVIFDRPYLRSIGSPFAGCREDLDENHPSVRFFYERLLPTASNPTGVESIDNPLKFPTLSGLRISA